MEEQEIFKVYFKTHKRIYEVSNFGNVKCNGELIENIQGSRGYYIIYSGKFTVHRAVAELFIPNTNNLPEVDHIDGNKHNNNASNLEWVSHKENMKRYYKSDLYKIRHKILIERTAKLKEKIIYKRCYYYKDNVFYNFNDLYNFINTNRKQQVSIQVIRNYCASYNIYKNYYIDQHGNIYDINKNIIFSNFI